MDSIPDTCIDPIYTEEHSSKITLHYKKSLVYLIVRLAPILCVLFSFFFFCSALDGT